MTTFNLIPGPYAARLHDRRVVARWIMAVVTWSLVVGLACAVARATTPEDTDRVVERAMDATARAEGMRKEATRFKSQALAASRELAARRAVGEHPDWSLLLARLAADKGDAIVLEQCDLSRSEIQAATAKPSATKAAARRRYVVDIAGVAPTQTEVLKFVSTVEAWRVFDKVTLEESKSRTARGTQALWFRVRCLLDEAGDER